MSSTFIFTDTAALNATIPSMQMVSDQHHQGRAFASSHRYDKPHSHASAPKGSDLRHTLIMMSSTEGAMSSTFIFTDTAALNTTIAGTQRRSSSSALAL